MSVEQKINRFSKGKIYKLTKAGDENTYVGSTCLELSRRLSNHRADSLVTPHRRVYKQFPGMDGVDIVLIELYPCNTLEELRKRERYWADELKSSLNTFRAHVTEEEKKEKHKEYAVTHAEEISVYQSAWYQEHKVELNAKQKIWKQDNKEKVRAHNAKARAKQVRKQCPCGGFAKSVHSHKKTMMHKVWETAQLALVPAPL